MMALRPEFAPPLRRARREIGIRGLLEWAFGREMARLDLDDRIGVARPGVGIEYIMMQRGLTGARIDGGGRSLPHDDAELVADAVAHLPVEHGGRGMAVRIAELARTGCCPDPMVGARSRVQPEDWHVNRYGRRAATAWVGDLGLPGPHWSERRGRKGNLVRERIMVCPVVISPTACQIAAARRAYLQWWGALLHLRATLQRCDLLACHDVTDAMPPLAPWRKSLDFEI